MNVKTVTFSKTKQVHPYEPERIELTIELAEGDLVEDAVARARRTCDALLGNFPDELEAEQARQILAAIEAPRFR